ncbi:putative PHD type zinc finger protein with BAH domain-containing protein, partial [Coemansia spiralis]
RQLADRMAVDSDSVQGRESTPTPSPTPGSGGDTRLSVRIARFQRARDLPVTQVRAKDMRLLIATMQTVVIPVAAIKAKCQVRHEAEIPDLGAWKAQPDHYWYTQLFDCYSTRFYDITPVAQIRNAPQEVLQKLLDTYEFIFAEPQKINDLVSTRRACTVCAKWCSISESVKCTLCDKHYHLKCLDPPPSRKPAKGYGWQCAACLRRIQDQRTRAAAAAAATDEDDDEDDEDVDDDDYPAVDPAAVAGEFRRVTRNKAAGDEPLSSRRSHLGTGGPPTPSGAAASSDTEARYGSKRLKVSHSDSRSDVEVPAGPIPRPKNRGLWPFRYFGINTDTDDVLHDDERIYPRAVSRIGPKYQAIVPDMVSPSGPALDKELAQKRAAIDQITKDHKSRTTAAQLINKVLHSHKRPSTPASSTSHATGGIGGGGGGGTTRWHGKSAEQMDRVWDEIEVQRGNRDAELFFRQPKSLPDDELEMYMEAIVPFLRRHFAALCDFTLLDCQDTALHGLALHKYDVEEALISIPDCPKGYTRQRDAGDYWTPAGVSKFRECLRAYGSNLQSIHECLPDTTRRAVTLRYYLLRHTSAGEQLLDEFANRHRAGQRRLILGQGDISVNPHAQTASDAGISIDGTPPSSPPLGRDSPMHAAGAHELPGVRCANCATEHTGRWFSAPPDLAFYNTRNSKSAAARRVVCSDCRSFWLHYGLMPDPDTVATRKTQPGVLPLSVRSEPRRPISRMRQALPQAALKSRPPEAWPLTPCGVCRLATDSSTAPAALVCGDCGLCVHIDCSGYPASARINPRRWKCGVCTNVTNPTVSINYECILCRGEPPVHTGAQPRPLMWRTIRNNWVHPLCALAVRETSLLYTYGNVIVGNTADIPDGRWRRPCAVCASAGGVVHACAAAGCDTSIHALCASFSEGAAAADAAPRATLAIQVSGGDAGADAAVVDAARFVAGGGSAEIVVRCASHSGSSRDIDIGAVDGTGRPVLAAVVLTKRAGPDPAAWHDMPHPSAAAAPQHSAASPVAVQRLQTPISNGHANSAANNGPVQTSPPPAPAARTKAFAWACAAKDPACSRCAIGFSPIWWPAGPTPANGGTADIKVLCQRCYSVGTAGGQQRNLAPSS